MPQPSFGYLRQHAHGDLLPKHVEPADYCQRCCGSKYWTYHIQIHLVWRCFLDTHKCTSKWTYTQTCVTIKLSDLICLASAGSVCESVQNLDHAVYIEINLVVYIYIYSHVCMQKSKAGDELILCRYLFGIPENPSHPSGWSSLCGFAARIEAVLFCSSNMRQVVNGRGCRGQVF